MSSSLITDVSVQRVGPISKGQEVRKELEFTIYHREGAYEQCII